MNEVQNDKDDGQFRRSVGTHIRILRAANEMSQEKLANAAGVSRNYVSAIERGRQSLDIIRMRRLAAALHVKYGELLTGPKDGIWGLPPQPAESDESAESPESPESTESTESVEPAESAEAGDPTEESAEQPESAQPSP